MTYELSNAAYRLTVETADRDVYVVLRDLAMDFDVANGPYMYRAVRSDDEGAVVAGWLNGVAVETGDGTLRITGTLAGLSVEHLWNTPAGRAVMEERLVLRNATGHPIALEAFATGLRRRVTDETGAVLPEVGEDRFVAVPFRHRPTDPAAFDVDFRVEDLLTRPGREHRINGWPPSWPRYGHVPSMHRMSEGWAWTHGNHTLGMFKFNQDALEFSILAVAVEDDGVWLRFGGAAMAAGDPSVLGHIEPGQRIELGVTRYETVEGGYEGAYYAFRAFLDEHGCRFPENYNPPVHWNELYDNPEWHLGTPGNPPGPRMTRPVTYTKALLEAEAEKARAYGCESLYLDPGWDTDFGTFLWGEAWLGPRKQFVRDIRERYGLGVSLHCPLATWMARDGRGTSSWPEASFQMDREGRIVPGAVCLGSAAYLDEAAKRLLAHCADGVTFLMFDGNWWNGGCWNPRHGHPVPYTKEDHVRANVELARRIHAQYPDVLIEMHDMLTGGTRQRYTPVYYKYGLPGSYDENWGFELMWEPMEDLRSGRARSLYYYNLGCNVPVYLHIDLRDDNEHALVLWWYASTCRHLGIGGTHARPAVAEAQKQAMRQYRRLERFYKQGEFFGMHEEAHVHALPGEHAFVVNLFNLSDAGRLINGDIDVARMGLDPDRWYIVPKGGHFDRRSGRFSVRRPLAPWGAETLEVRAIPG